MKRLVTENIGWKLLSLGLAILLWLAVVGDPELTTSVSVPVEFRSIPADLEISSDMPERISLVLRGPSSKLTPLSLSEAAAVVNLSDVHRPGERTFSLQQWRLNLPGGVILTRATPSQIRLRFERRVTRAVSVQVRFAGPPPAGYRIAEQQVRPEKLRIAGPESRVMNIESVETDSIELAGVVSESTFQVHAYVPDPQVRFEASPIVTVSVSLERIPRR
jgi:YbbR domain-containing protein